MSQLVEKARQYAKVLKDFQEVNFNIFYSIISNFHSFQAIRENEHLTSKSK